MPCYVVVLTETQKPYRLRDLIRDKDPTFVDVCRSIHLESLADNTDTILGGDSGLSGLQYGFTLFPGFAKDFNNKSLHDLMEMLWHPTSERQFVMYEALRKGAKV